MSLCLRGAGFNSVAAACVGGPPPLLPGVRWPFAGVWRAGAVSSGVCGGLIWLDPRLASLAWCCGVLWCAVQRRVVFCCAASCWSVPCCGAPCWAAPCCAVSRRAVPLCASLRRVVLWRAVLWGALSCCVALWCAAVRCAVLPCVVPWWVSGGYCGPCYGQECGSERGWLVAGGGGQVLVARWVRAVGVWVCRSGWWVG